MTLTGRRRYRLLRGWWKSYLVLQVEIRVLVSENYGSHVECEYVTQWIDATPEHITEYV